MDPPHPSRSVDETYSRNPRSRASSHRVSTTEALLQTLQLAESSPVGTAPFETASYTSSSRPPSSRGLASPTYNSPSLPHQPSPFLTCQLSHQQPPHHPSSPYQLRAEGPLDTNWFGDHRSPRLQAAPLLRVEPAPEELDTPASSPPLSSIESGAMSAVALPYDQFSMGSRNSFTWPGVEQSNGLLGPDINHHYASDASLTPPSGSRSVTASPPRSSLTAEQRELKRQRDQARHNSKMQARSQRAGSGSSSVYSPPATLADLATGASTMPVYTTAPPQMSLLTDPPTTQYLPSFSPPIPDHSQAGMFPSHYPPPSYMPEYGYPPAGPSMPSHYGRPMVSDPNMGMYQVPPVMGPGTHDPSGQVRVVTPKPKPQCWEHGCNGRQFSTFSNLLRHQREKSGQASKATCPNCGAEFTRTTARNGHLLHDKCKQKKSS
ncbi:hypothetical protein QBC34DRAFT_401134 [Podospora aff. communis PSN243]|uniref:C2H2-type domain-containing protein n=1 Tax=Podospora aff. communis PSN243 TaxID=3040156 RepID=A0AAV9GSX2_9PEZI|nr:hypothetical protein QBC34DRAFT_401134 [Podospora aff. communis PSN243]